MPASLLPYTVVVLDTSVIIKWFRQGEVLASQALTLRDAHVEGQVIISVPWLAIYEVANVLRYKGDLATSQVQEAVQSLFEMELEWALPSGTTIRRAVEIARVYETTVYDATFVTLAEMLKANFVTADEQLARRLGLPLVIFLGEVEPSL
jgi:predicted nucleic acid-binding protein